MRAKTRNRCLKRTALPMTVLMLTACGGGGGGGGGIGIADGGIRGTGASVGPVSGFGSVFVNGIRFETDGNVTSDDGIATENGLDKGMILRIEGQWLENGEGTAERVEYDDTFRGDVVITNETFDPDNSSVRESVTFTVYGQTIVADKQTVFSGVSLQTLATGSFVRVSGWRLPDGTYRASYVGDLTRNANDVEIEGAIDANSVNVGLQEFQINGFLIQYDTQDGTTFMDGVTVSDLQTPGFRVEVEGELTTVGGEPAIFATSLERDEDRRYRRGDDDDIEFSGPVLTAFDNASQTFTINGLTVLVPNNDVFDDGLTTNDLQPGLLVQVEGEFLNDGRVEAEEIEIREANAEVQGRINAPSIDFEAQTFRVGGVLVQVTPQTIITDDDEDNARIGLNDLNGNFDVEVEGIERSGQNGVFLEATKVEREEGEGEEDGEGNEFELTGKLTAIDSTTLTVLGVTMAADASVFDGTSRNALEDALGPNENPLIEVEYVESPQGSGNFVAEEVELEEDEEDNDGDSDED